MTTFRFRQREFVRIIEANLLGPVTDRFNQVCSHSHLLRLSAIEGLFDCLDTKKAQNSGEQKLSRINSLKLKGTFCKVKMNPHVVSIPAVCLSQGLGSVREPPGLGRILTCGYIDSKHQRRGDPEDTRNLIHLSAKVLLNLQGVIRGGRKKDWTPKELDVSNNLLGDKGATFLAKRLENSTDLEKLNLCNTNVTHVGDIIVATLCSLCFS